MKIAHINMFYLPTFGGVEQVMYELAQRQVKAGHEVHVYCCDSDKYKRIKKKYEIIDGVHVHRHRYLFRLSLSTFIWPSLLFTLPRKKFDIIHTHVSGHLYVLLAGLIAKLKKTVHVHTTHCPWTEGFRPFLVRILVPFTYLFLNKIAFKFITKIVAITPWEFETLEKFTNKNKITNIPNGTDAVLYKKIKPNNFKKRHKIKGKLVLFFGRLNPTKGPDILAKAAVNITKKRKDIHFVFVGPDEGMADTVKKIIKGNPNIKYLGPIRGKEKIAEMYQAADIYVLPSYREGLPLTLFEAMASGLPIVASPVNGVPYEMKDPDNGYFVNYGNIKALQEKILKILDNSKIAKKMSKNNKNKAKNYTWDIITRKYILLYNKLLQNQR